MVFSTIINFDSFSQLVPLVRGSIIAGIILGVLAGLIGPMIHARDLAFAIHGTSELSFAGAAVALFFGASVTKGAVVGSLVAALILGIRPTYRTDRRSGYHGIEHPRRRSDLRSSVSGYYLETIILRLSGS